MPRWVIVLLLGIGAVFLAVAVVVGVFGTRAARARLERLQRMPVLSATAFEDQRVGDAALVEGTISSRNPAVFRSYVAYQREEMDVTTDTDGDRRESWRSTGGETPPLLIDADGVVLVANQSYRIDRPHETWYDDATMGFDDRPRDGSLRYSGLEAGKPVTVYGTVADGAEGHEMMAQTVFGGTHAEYLASQRTATAVWPILGGIFGVVGGVLCVLGLALAFRR